MVTAFALAVGFAVHITPLFVTQGDPVMFTVTGAAAADIASAEVGGTPVDFFAYNGSTTALYGTSINEKTGPESVYVTLNNGKRYFATFMVVARAKPVESLAVPAQLGGNSVANQLAFVAKLEKDNASIAAVQSTTTGPLWSRPPMFPVASTTAEPLVVTDPYGYGRDSGAATVTHKGVDFRAPIGTPVYAVDNGIVRVATNYYSYGDTVIIDHGLGLLSMYMHMSKLFVSPGETVARGQEIGLSGETGYAEGPHLHLSIRINGQSIDPMAFYALFGLKP